MATEEKKTARRGRKQDDSLPPSRSRDVQRAFRARKVEQLAELTQRIKDLEEENDILRARLGDPPRERRDQSEASNTPPPPSTASSYGCQKSGSSAATSKSGCCGGSRKRQSSPTLSEDADRLHRLRTDNGGNYVSQPARAWNGPTPAVEGYSPSSHYLDPSMTAQLVSQVQAHAHAQQALVAAAQLAAFPSALNQQSHLRSTSTTLDSNSAHHPESTQRSHESEEVYDPRFPFATPNAPYWAQQQAAYSRPADHLPRDSSDPEVQHLLQQWGISPSQAPPAQPVFSLSTTTVSDPRTHASGLTALDQNGNQLALFTPSEGSRLHASPSAEDENSFLRACCGVLEEDLPALPEYPQTRRRERLQPFHEFCLLLMRHLVAKSRVDPDDEDTFQSEEECCGGIVSCSGPLFADAVPLPTGYIKATVAFQKLLPLMERSRLEVDDVVTILSSDQGGLRLNDFGVGHWVQCEKAFGLVVRDEVVIGGQTVIQAMMKTHRAAE